MSTLKLIWCVIYLAREKYTQLVTLISRDEKNNTSAVWGPPEAWGPRARAHQAHWIRRHWGAAKILGAIVKHTHTQLTVGITGSVTVLRVGYKSMLRAELVLAYPYL